MASCLLLLSLSNVARGANRLCSGLEHHHPSLEQPTRSVGRFREKESTVAPGFTDSFAFSFHFCRAFVGTHRNLGLELDGTTVGSDQFLPALVVVCPGAD